jgi:hypothetical protein
MPRPPAPADGLFLRIHTFRLLPGKPCVYAASRRPTAVNLAAFEKLCQQQKAGFHRFFMVFVGFYGIFALFEGIPALIIVAKALSGAAAKPPAIA